MRQKNIGNQFMKMFPKEESLLLKQVLINKLTGKKSICFQIIIILW